MKTVNLMIFTLLLSTFSISVFARPGVEAKNIAAENCTDNCHPGIDTNVCPEAYGAKTCQEMARIKAAATFDGLKNNQSTTSDAVKDSKGP